MEAFLYGFLGFSVGGVIFLAFRLDHALKRITKLEIIIAAKVIGGGRAASLRSSGPQPSDGRGDGLEDYGAAEAEQLRRHFRGRSSPYPNQPLC